MVSCTLYFDVLIIELFKICQVKGKNSGESTLSKVFFDVSEVRWEVSLVWEPSKWTSEEV